MQMAASSKSIAKSQHSMLKMYGYALYMMLQGHT